MFADYTKIYVKAGDGGDGARLPFIVKNMWPQAGLMAETAEKAAALYLK